ncbi:MAG TPA: DUF481 domain-containing protein [Steroidobacteraceae bacterium]|nr:DUF481 domain-containing protein [Steroidobacteraceae bacterium]
MKISLAGVLVARYLAAAAAILLATAAQAEWKGKGELGLVIAKGNTETQTINAKADLSTESDQPWKHSVGFSALRSEDEDGLTGDRFEAHAQSDYKFSPRTYALGTLRYDDDKFSPYTYQAVGSVGYGYKFFDTEPLKLSGEIGVGYRRYEEREVILEDATTGDITVIPALANGEAIVRGAVNYDHKLTATTSVFDKFLVEAGSDNTYLQNELGVAVKMTDMLALSVAYLVRHNTDINEAAIPVPKKTDQLMTVNLVFAF